MPLEITNSQPLRLLCKASVEIEGYFLFFIAETQKSANISVFKRSYFYPYNYDSVNSYTP
jgi:hypothetical protein